MGNRIEAVLELASQQRGAFVSRQADAAGVTRAQLRAATGQGVIRHVGRSQYVVTGSAPDWRRELWLAHLSIGEGSAIAVRAAARLHGLPGYRQARPQALIRTGGSHRAFGVQLHETFWLPAEHVVLVDGLPTTSIARTLFDLAGYPPTPDGFRNQARREAHKRQVKRAFNRALARHGLTMAAVVRVLAALGRRGKPGTTIIRELVHEFGEFYVPTESDLEDAVVDVLAANGVEQPERQVDMSDDEGWIGRVDFLVRRDRHVVEVDGPDHDTPLQARIDADRDRRLLRAGFRVDRIHWSVVIDDPESVLSVFRPRLKATG